MSFAWVIRDNLIMLYLMKPNGCTLLHSKLKPSGIFYFWFRSSRSEVYCKKGVLKNFAKFTGKHLSQSLFLNKVAGLRPATLLKKRLWHRCFLVNFTKFLRTTFLTEHFRWLLLLIYSLKRELSCTWLIFAL